MATETAATATPQQLSSDPTASDRKEASSSLAQQLQNIQQSQLPHHHQDGAGGSSTEDNSIDVHHNHDSNDSWTNGITCTSCVASFCSWCGSCLLMLIQALFVSFFVSALVILLLLVGPYFFFNILVLACCCHLCVKDPPSLRKILYFFFPIRIFSNGEQSRADEENEAWWREMDVFSLSSTDSEYQRIMRKRERRVQSLLLQRRLESIIHVHASTNVEAANELENAEAVKHDDTASNEKHKSSATSTLTIPWAGPAGIQTVTNVVSLRSEPFYKGRVQLTIKTENEVYEGDDEERCNRQLDQASLDSRVLIFSPPLYLPCSSNKSADVSKINNRSAVKMGFHCNQVDIHKSTPVSAPQSFSPLPETGEQKGAKKERAEKESIFICITEGETDCEVGRNIPIHTLIDQQESALPHSYYCHQVDDGLKVSPSTFPAPLPVAQEVNRKASEGTRKSSAIITPVPNTMKNIDDLDESVAAHKYDESDQCLCFICLLKFDVDDVIAWSFNEKCNHSYHADCITYWLARRQPRMMSCPVCRQAYLIQPHNLGSVQATSTNTQ